MSGRQTRLAQRRRSDADATARDERSAREEQQRGSEAPPAATSPDRLRRAGLAPYGEVLDRLALGRLRRIVADGDRSSRERVEGRQGRLLELLRTDEELGRCGRSRLEDEPVQRGPLGRGVRLEIEQVGVAVAGNVGEAPELTGQRVGGDRRELEVLVLVRQRDEVREDARRRIDRADLGREA